jgi:hypothetical protein
MMHALKDRGYKSRLDEAKKEGLKIQLTGVPTFIINNKHKIVGAQLTICRKNGHQPGCLFPDGAAQSPAEKGND